MFGFFPIFKKIRDKTKQNPCSGILCKMFKFFGRKSLEYLLQTESGDFEQIYYMFFSTYLFLRLVADEDEV